MMATLWPGANVDFANIQDGVQHFLQNSAFEFQRRNPFALEFRRGTMPRHQRPSFSLVPPSLRRAISEIFVEPLWNDGMRVFMLVNLWVIKSGAKSRL